MVSMICSSGTPPPGNVLHRPATCFRRTGTLEVLSTRHRVKGTTGVQNPSYIRFTVGSYHKHNEGRSIAGTIQRGPSIWRSTQCFLVIGCSSCSLFPHNTSMPSPFYPGTDGQELEIGQTEGFPWIWIGHHQASNRLMNKIRVYSMSILLSSQARKRDWPLGCPVRSVPSVQSGEPQR